MTYEYVLAGLNFICYFNVDVDGILKITNKVGERAFSFELTCEEVKAVLTNEEIYNELFNILGISDYSWYDVQKALKIVGVEFMNIAELADVKPIKYEWGEL